MAFILNGYVISWGFVNQEICKMIPGRKKMNKTKKKTIFDKQTFRVITNFLICKEVFLKTSICKLHDEFQTYSYTNMLNHDLACYK